MTDSGYRMSGIERARCEKDAAVQEELQQTKKRLEAVVKHLKDMRSNTRVLRDIAPKQRAFLAGLILQLTDLIEFVETGK